MDYDVDGVILAAGFSSRTGVFKMGLKLREKTLIERTIDAMKGLCSRLIVVSGYKREQIIKLTKGQPGVEVVFNPHYSAGMFTSVKEGIKHVKSGWFFLIPGDYPLVTKAIYQKLLDTRARFVGEHIFIPVVNGRKGHPILVKSELTPELLEEPENSNLRKFINRKGYAPVQVDDDSILVDIDTMEDYQRVKKKLEQDE